VYLWSSHVLPMTLDIGLPTAIILCRDSPVGLLQHQAASVAEIL